MPYKYNPFTGQFDFYESAAASTSPFEDTINVKIDYSAVGDSQRVTDGVVTATSTTLTSATGSFASGDVGKTIFVREDYSFGAVGKVLETTIATFVSSTEITLTDAATETDTNVYVVWGTDDTTPLQNALNALDSDGGRLYIPTGIYLTTSGLTLSSKSSIVIFGDGTGSELVNAGDTILTISGVGPAFTYVAQSLDGYAKGILVEDLTLDGMFMGLGGTGLILNFVAFSHINRIWVRNLGTVIEQQGVSRTYFTNISNAVFANGLPNARMFCGYGFYYDVTIAGAVENDNTYSAIWLTLHRTGFHFIGTNTLLADGVNIFDTRIQNWGSGTTWYDSMEGIHIEHGAYITIEGTHIFGSGSYNIYLYNTRGAVINGNILWEGGRAGTDLDSIFITGTLTSFNYSNTITNNYIEKPYRHGIHCDSGDQITITGNNIWKPSEGSAGTYNGIHIVDCESVDITGNNVSHPAGGDTQNKDIVTSGTCLNTRINHAYPGEVDLTGGGEHAGSITIQEVDGTPSIQATLVKFPNTTVTDNGDNTATVTFSTDIVADGGAYTDPPADVDRIIDGGSYV